MNSHHHNPSASTTTTTLLSIFDQFYTFVITCVINISMVKAMAKPTKINTDQILKRILAVVVFRSFEY